MVCGRVVNVTTEGGDQLVDQLAKKYLNEDSYPFRRPEEVRVILKILLCADCIQAGYWA